MSGIFLRASVATARLWTHIYTCGLPSELRDARREEIACDVWHATQAPDSGSGWRIGSHIVLRVLLGIPDDLGWRMECRQDARWGFWASTAGTLAVVAIAGAWALARVAVPPVPPTPALRLAVELTDPPPPPPPPAARSARTSPAAVHVTYGRASYTIATLGAAPARIKEVLAVYPPILAAAPIEGVVILQGRITESGRVADLRVVQPQGLLTQTAFDAIRQWEFEAGGNAPNTLTVSVRFARPDSISSDSITQ